MVKRRKLWPVHLEPLWDDPDYRTLDSVGRGIVMSIIETAWQSDLAPMPTPADDEGWALAARARADEWASCSKAVLAIWRRYEPVLVEAMARRAAWQAQSSAWGKKSAAASAAARASRKATERTPTADVQVTPQVWKPAAVGEPPVGGAPRVWRD